MSSDQAGNHTVDIDGVATPVEGEVLQHLRLNGLHVVLLRASREPRYGTKRNLVGIGSSGVVWRADTPTSQTGDHYVEAVVDRGRIRATSFSDRVVWLDEQSGRIVGEVPHLERYGLNE